MVNKKKILITDDNEINRAILCKILGDSYDLLQAENGKEALEIMEKNTDLSLLLLDIVMPIMDGYEVLASVRKNENLSGIPIIVTTGNNNEEDEIRCLSEGASDFVTKPFNPKIVKHRVESIIRLREKSALLNELEFDKLTGALSKEFFYDYVSNEIKKNPDAEYDLICCDVENFKLINEKYGTETGDKILCAISTWARENSLSAKLCGRIASNTFAAVVEHREYSHERFENITHEIYKNTPFKTVVLNYGIYEIRDTTIPISKMCDRAMIAMQDIKRKYGVYYAKYDDNLRLKLIRENQITDMMEDSLADNQFVVYFQPKHDVKTKLVAGAEALVRWIHPEFGFMSPGEFIPIFEKNGFITNLDKFVWEETCKHIKKWQDEGKVLIPISVNVSRADFENENLPEHFTNLIAKYGIPYDMLHLEVTETIYSDNPEMMIDVVDELRGIGFKIEMDDFGSGYSSLNMLSELPIDVLKLDMNFMKQHKNSANNKSILSFILSLSKWLGLPTIAEGVETMDEFHLLSGMGCNYVQGYYFAKPMPGDEFDKYIIEQDNSVRVDSEKKEVDHDKSYAVDVKRKSKVLVVEDIKMNREILVDMLSPYYEVATAVDGNQAYEYIKANNSSISVILLDLMMPVMDGFELMEIMKNDVILSKIPIIITSEAGQDSEVKSLQLGAESFLGKPYRKEVLLHHIESAIDRAELKKLKSKLEMEE